MPFSHSCIHLPEHGQDEMIEEESFVELAKACVRACRVLKTATDGRDINDLSGPSRGQIEDLGRCVNLIQLSSADNDE